LAWARLRQPRELRVGEAALEILDVKHLHPRVHRQRVQHCVQHRTARHRTHVALQPQHPALSVELARVATQPAGAPPRARVRISRESAGQGRAITWTTRAPGDAARFASALGEEVDQARRLQLLVAGAARAPGAEARHRRSSVARHAAALGRELKGAENAGRCRRRRRRSTAPRELRGDDTARGDGLRSKAARCALTQISEAPSLAKSRDSLFYSA